VSDLIDIVTVVSAQHELDFVTAVLAMHARHPATQGGLLGGLEIVGKVADALQTPPDKIVRAITVTGLQTSLHVSETCCLVHLGCISVLALGLCDADQVPGNGCNHVGQRCVFHLSCGLVSTVCFFCALAVLELFVQLAAAAHVTE